MKKITVPALLATALLGACSPDARQLNDANLSKAMNVYLAKRGDLCLAKSSWPVDVGPEENEGNSRNALQMPALEHVGLVAASDALAEQVDENGARSTRPVRRYHLTAEGNKYYLARDAHKYPTASRFAAADKDFCAAKLSLDRVVGWEQPGQPAKGAVEAVVSYTYKIAPAPWTADADVRRVFPMVDRLIRGAGVLQLKETMVLTESGWEARDL
jgi:hypothetical protein